MRRAWFLLVAGLGTACAPTPIPHITALPAKIDFDLTHINPDGLLVIDDRQQVAVHYEFCVPDIDRFLDLVSDIDPSAVAHESRGRVGCGEGERLLVGTTHQPEWRKVLDELSALPFISRISRTMFE